MEEQTKLQTQKHSDSEIKCLLEKILHPKLGNAINLGVIHEAVGPPEGDELSDCLHGMGVVKPFISVQFARCEG